MSTETNELKVPRTAFAALEQCTNDDAAHGATCVLAIAAPVVVAELRRLADYLPGRWDDIVGSANVADIADDILERADELEAGQ